MAKKYKYFYKSGLWPDNEHAFFSAHNSKYCNIRNPYDAIYQIPYEFYKKNFRYNRSTGIYENNLKYSDLKPYTIIRKDSIIIYQN
jgi:hypothetical protein